jgi:phosphoribosyl-AMP cyclohydrolase / phosphoribosyl-ATP pyrophosphohydrolase
MRGEDLNFDKLGGLVPAVIQDSQDGKVLMTGFMNHEAFDQTRESGKVTFYSRTRNRLWQKGETSGNVMDVVSMFADCDNDTLLIQVRPAGPVCHTGASTCFKDDQGPNIAFLNYLQQLIKERRGQSPESSYTARLFEKGTARIAQKVGEEAVESIIEAMKGNREKLTEEAADLLYHLMVLLADQDLDLMDVVAALKARHK